MAKRTKTETQEVKYTEFMFDGENGNSFEGRIYPKNTDSEKAEIYPLSITINGLAIVGCKLVGSAKGYFIGFPQYKTKSGDYKSQVYFFTKEDMADCQACADYLIKLVTTS